MNTPAHVVINMAILSRGDDHKRTAAIVAGALIPDLVIIGFYAWHLVLGTPEAQIWSVEYYKPVWQGYIDVFNSIPILLIALLLCWKIRHGLLWILLASMLLHTLGDLPVHHDDGHRHFFPFSDWIFASPVSYWDVNHHGAAFSVFEVALVAVLSAVLYARKSVHRIWVIGSVSIYTVYWMYVFAVWY